MTTQTIFRRHTIASIHQQPSTYTIKKKPIQVSTCDYGFDIDEDELASELLARLPNSLNEQTIPEIDPNEFETMYQWFLS